MTIHSVRLSALSLYHQSGGKTAGQIQANRKEVSENQEASLFSETLIVQLSTLKEIFEVQAAQTPDAVAVSSGSDAITYRELNSRANRVAHWLIGLGVVPENRVGVCLERTTDLIVSLVGIIKAGAAYLPLDPEYPAARLSQMVTDANPTVVLTTRSLQSVLPPATTLGVIDAPETLLDQFSNANPEAADASNLQPHHPAYVIYTSGSTGIPKGTVITHDNVVRLFLSTLDWFHFGPQDVWTLFHSVSFDFSVWEIWGSLLTGGRLVIVPKLVSRSPAEFLKLLVEERVTILNQTPSAFYQLIEADAIQPELGRQLSLRAIIFGGESLTLRNLQSWYSRHPDTTPRLYNMYGITETTVHVTWQPLTAEMARADEESLIGQSIPDLRVYVLDSQLSPVAVGEIGELFVAGPGLARGYLNRPGLTAERFLADPFSPQPGERMYRSGDLARLRADGNLVYCGRSDQQVKIRGFRIELPEIEAVLLSHPAVSQVAVVVREENPEDRRLVAYVVPDPFRAYPLRQLLQFQRSGALTPEDCHTLSNGMIVCQQNTSETEIVDQEIFVERSYLKFGITLPPAACVFDVGANIGLFTLFIRQLCPDATIYAFEPIPPLFQKLAINSSLLPGETHLFECGLSHRAERATFTWYPHNSVTSGRFADAAEDRATVKSVLRSQSRKNDLDEVALEGLVRDRLSSEEFICPLRTLSEVIAEHNIERIDLLKIDVEKSEWNVLQGISPEDWPKIDQLVVEVQGIQGRLGEIESLLRNQGFDVVVDQDTIRKTTSRFSVYARRPITKGLLTVAIDQPEANSYLWNASELTDLLGQHLRGHLPDYMIPNDLVLLDSLPLTTNGKLDRAALPAPSQFRIQKAVPERLPSSPLEHQLARLFSDVLGRESVSVDDNFFEIGGHSLLVMRMAANSVGVLGSSIPVRWVFENPTVARLAQRIEGAADLSQETSVIPKASRFGQLAASVGQTQLWLTQQVLDDSATYNQPIAFRISGPLDRDRVLQAFNEILVRHEVLRTALVLVGGILIQRVCRATEIRLPSREITVHEDLPSWASVVGLPQIMSEIREPFDLAAAPLWRVCWVNLSNGEQLLICTFHHSILDEWSVRLFAEELAALYDADGQSDQADLPELRVQFADYSAWQLAQYTEDLRKADLRYWSEQLADLPGELELPTDRPSPQVPSGRGAITEFRLNNHLVIRLRELVRKESTTLFSLLLTAFQVWLFRITGQSDLVIGTPLARRERPEVQPLIGYFLNTLPIRSQLDANWKFHEVLQRTIQTLHEAYFHADFPFAEMIELAAKERKSLRQPIYQVMFVLLEEGLGNVQLGEAQAIPVFLHTGTSKNDLMLDIQAFGDEWVCRFEYATDRFDASTIERLAETFVVLLEGLVANPEIGIDRLPLLTERQEDQVLIEWNQTRTNYPFEKTVHELFEAQVQRQPDALAMVFGSQSITYRQLNCVANQLAQDLRNRGVGPDVLVGLHADRSLEVLVGLLGILKAGGAYLPLDPAYPSERLRVILQDSQVRFIVSQPRLADQLPACGAEVIPLQPDVGTVDPGIRNPVNSSNKTHLAYVLYTSGSTGRPKGVAMEHGALTNLICWQNSQSSLGSGSRTLQFASLGFDVSFQEIFSTWCSGGTLVLVDEMTRRDMNLLMRLINRERIARLFVPYVVLQQLTEVVMDTEGSGSSLREVVTAGEQLQVTPQLVQFFQQIPHCRLINQYGPTEAHVVTSYELTGDRQLWPALPPIGRPISNTQIYVLDSKLQPVPVGVSGELYIGGIGVARGYLNNAELTSEKFVLDPFRPVPGGRMYRTGDKGRWRSEGVLEFQGRLDHQVKYRGFRIELGEIESVLNRCPQVSQSIVMLREDRPGEKRLVAYLVPVDPSSVSPRDCREFARQRLPEYMIPTSWVILDSLPLTVNGKLDRKALPVPGLEGVESGEARMAPRTPLEEILAEGWKQVLRVDDVGVDENFFELGGHSLLAMRLVSYSRSALELEIPIRSVFEHPTISGLATMIDSTRRSGKASSGDLPLRVVDRTERLPMSYAQERMWFLDRYEENHFTYNVPWCWKLQGSLNGEVLERCLVALVERHEPLRTTFLEANGKLWQEIQSGNDFRLEKVDLRSVALEDREKKARELYTSEATRPFDLSRDLMLRGMLIQLGDTDYWLVLVLHHIASDGWSLGVLERELAALYQATLAGEPSPLPRLSVQYADYAVWQRQWLQGAFLETQLNYWKRQLAGIPVLLELPTDDPRPDKQEFRGAHCEVHLDAGLTQSLKDLSRREHVTLFMTLLAGWQVLLSRYSGQRDIVVGAPIAGRQRGEFENLVGFFVNTLVLRANLEQNPTVRELLHQVRDTTLSAYAHQDIPFERLVQELKPHRSLNHSPLFQVMFVLQTATGALPTIPGLFLDRQELDTRSAKFDLLLSLEETPEGLRGILEYDTHLFRASTVSRMIDHFQILLEGLVTNPETRIDQLPFLTKREQDQVLIEWNQTRRDYPFEKTVHELFEAQVQRQPNAIAMVFGSQSITYRQLNCVANQLAQDLRNRGVGPDVVVGLHADRSMEVLVGLLGILKAGGAYLPLDPAYPSERLRVILQDSQVRFIVSQPRLADQLPACSAEVIPLQPDVGTVDPEIRNPVNFSNKTHLAYVLYTSGSTGRPKGVAMEHGALTNLICWQNSQSSLGSGSRTLQFASLGFDVSFQEIFSTWCSGGTLVLVDEMTRRDMNLLMRLINRERIARLFVPYVVLQQLTEVVMDTEGSGSSLREVVTAGEQLQVTPQLVQFFQQIPHCRLINQYGPTEAHVVTSYELTGDRQLWPALPPIGRPISNTQIYVLDSKLQPVPVGVSGELYIGGIGVARGYLNNAELTSEKFVLDPFRPVPGGRMYRTGDKGRWRSEGVLEFQGRLDHQVKYRGFRIELGEIESVLNRCPQVSQSIVMLREDRPGEKRLVSYIVPVDPSSISPRDYREFARQRLPEYMIPTSWVILDSLPLTVNGKLDRKALPVPGLEGVESGEARIAPRTPLEEILAEGWKQVLRVDDVGVDENFFELGGHSLLAMRLVSYIRSALEMEIPIRSVFEHPTISGLATMIDSTRRSGKASSGDLPLRVVDRTERLPMSYAQERMWFLDRYEENHFTYNVPWCWKLQGSLNGEVLERCLVALVERHEPLRTTFLEANGKLWQEIQSGNDFRLEKVDLRSVALEDREKKARELYTSEATRPFDLSRDLMLRGMLIQLGDTDYWLVLVLHHIASDGWSLGVLERELAALYQATLAGEPSPLPRLSVQYADYAVWQRQWLQGAFLETQLNYWKRQLAGIPVLLELPTDDPRPDKQEFRGAHCEVHLDAGLTQSLKDLSRREHVTLFMTLLAGWQVLLSRYSGQRDIVVGAPIAGRQRGEFENLVGFFVNTLVLRANLEQNPTVRELLHQVRDTTLSAYAHQDIPFERLVQELKPHRSLNHSPLFQVMFVLQTATGALPTIPGLFLDRQELDTRSAKFDLLLSLEETPEGLRGILEYDTHLFRASTVSRMIDHFQILLEGLVTNPETRIDQLPFLTKREQDQVLIEWNQTRRDYPFEKTVHELFEAQVRRRPDAIAVECGDAVLTYEELNRRSNQLAHHLQKRGVGSEQPVGICVDRSFEMIIGLLAILKAGGAYVPLDPNYPDERLAVLVSDTGISLILTQSHRVDRWEGFPMEMVILDDNSPVWSSEACENLSRPVQADQLAYVIFTSGSTGVPKGVEVLHRGIVRLLCETDYVRLDESQSVLQLAVLSFDASTFEIWGPLLHGGRCVLAPPQLPDLEDLGRLLQEKKVRTLWLTSTLFNVVVDENVQILDGVEQLLVGGEALSVSHIRRAQQSLGPRTQLINGYGPTESTTFACCYRLPGEIGTETRSIPIGRPIANTTAYVLDRHREPVPIGVAGELYLGGDGLARGYLNEPQLTTEKFVPDLFSTKSHARMYRTGDLVRWREDGVLEFLGRIDNQVKLRGFRIELGEIEAVLLCHPHVKQAVAILREDRPGDKRIVAYVVPRPSEMRPAVTEVRQFLQEKLPEYMVPAAVVVLDAVPLTPNGKLDRKSLPAPEFDRAYPELGYVAPRTPAEEMVASVWMHVLGLEKIGVHDNFFELGGHSLLVIQAIDGINRMSSCKLKIADLFSHPTVAELAETLQVIAPESDVSSKPTYLETIRSGQGPTHLVIVGATIRAPLNDLPQHLPVWWLKLDGLHVLPHLDLDIPTQVTLFVKELTAAIPSGTILLCGHSYGGLLAFEIAHQLRHATQYRIELIVLEPAPVWNPPPPLMKRIAHHATRAFHSRGRIWGLKRLVKTFSEKVSHRILKKIVPRRHARATGLESFDQFERMVHYFIGNIRRYDFPIPFENTIHLIATPDYLKSSVEKLKLRVTGGFHEYPVPSHFTHLDVARPENSRYWVEVVNQRVSVDRR